MGAASAALLPTSHFPLGYVRDISKERTMAIATIGRWGKTLAVRLPKELALAVRFRDGDVVELQEVDGEVRLRKREPVTTLDALFAGRSSQEWRAAYRDAYDWGEDIGRERVPE
jgi:antitoxin MazE